VVEGVFFGFGYGWFTEAFMYDFELFFGDF